MNDPEYTPDEREPDDNKPDAVHDRLAWDYDDIASLAEICEAVPESDEPRLCGCGKHYVGAPCPRKEPDETST